jgi:excisionase family DNA binding protein
VTAPASSPPAVMTIEELAEYLRIPVRTAYYWRQSGDGPTPYRVGRFLRYRRDEVEAWLTAQATTPPARRRGRSS